MVPELPLLNVSSFNSKQKKTALEENENGNWGTIFLSNYYWSWQHFGQTFSQPDAFYWDNTGITSIDVSLALEVLLNNTVIKSIVV